jgi:hypothetical protein
LSSDSGSYQCLPKVEVSGVALRGELVRVE